LTKPAVSVTENHQQRWARLASSVILLLFVLSAVGVLLNIRLVVVPILLIVSYMVSRTRYYRAAILMALMSLSLPSFIIAASVDDPTQRAQIAMALNWVILPMILSSLFLSVRRMVLLTVLNVVGILCVKLIVAYEVPEPEIWPAMWFIVMASTLMIISTGIRQYYLTQSQFDELRQAQRALQRANTELEAANREVRDFAYIIAHDLRSPLVNMVGFMDEVRYALQQLTPVLQSELPSMDANRREQARTAFFEDLPEAIDYVDTSINKMEYLIEQILRLSRLGQRELHRHYIEVTPLVNEIIETMTYELDQQEAWTTVHELPNVAADPVAFLQIMSNLIDNSIKYLDPNRAGMIEIRGEKTPDETIFHVTDNGRGIADADKPKVFQLFRRVGDSKGIRGKGMGLAYVQTLVQRHGGRVWFDSTYGEGTTFSFSIANDINFDGE